MRRYDVLIQLVNLVSDLSGNKAYFTGVDSEAYYVGGHAEVVVLASAKIMPEIKAFCMLYQDILKDVTFIPSDICYVPSIAYIFSDIISDIHPENGIFTRGMQ